MGRDDDRHQHLPAQTHTGAEQRQRLRQSVATDDRFRPEARVSAGVEAAGPGSCSGTAAGASRPRAPTTAWTSGIVPRQLSDGGPRRLPLCRKAAVMATALACRPERIPSRGARTNASAQSLARSVQAPGSCFWRISGAWAGWPRDLLRAQTRAEAHRPCSSPEAGLAAATPRAQSCLCAPGSVSSVTRPARSGSRSLRRLSNEPRIDCEH